MLLPSAKAGLSKGKEALGGQSGSAAQESSAADTSWWLEVQFYMFCKTRVKSATLCSGSFWWGDREKDPVFPFIAMQSVSVN